MCASALPGKTRNTKIAFFHSMCCTQLAGNAGHKKSPKIRHLGTIAQLCRAISSQLSKAHIDNREKNLLNSNISPTRPHNMDEIVSLVLGTPPNFNGSRVLAALLHDSTGRQRNFAALNRGRHLYLAGRPSHWALAHILVQICFPCSASLCSSSPSTMPTVTDTFLNSLVILTVV